MLGVFDLQVVHYGEICTWDTKYVELGRIIYTLFGYSFGMRSDVMIFTAALLVTNILWARDGTVMLTQAKTRGMTHEKVAIVTRLMRLGIINVTKSTSLLIALHDR